MKNHSKIQNIQETRNSKITHEKEYMSTDESITESKFSPCAGCGIQF